MSDTPRRGAAASYQVGAAKLRPPAPSSKLVVRERLTRRLHDASQPVMLVTGPAGAGKTTLVAAWASQATDVHVAWLDLDRHDNDVVRLWAGILAALRASGAVPPGSDLDVLEPPVAGTDGAFLDRFVDALARLGLPLCLVLDGLDELRSRSTLASLDLLLRRLPPGVGVVIVTRADPPLGLPRLRLDGRLVELRADELAFTNEEAGELLQQHEVEIGGAATDALVERTEGWAAGLRIAALAFAGGSPPDEVIDRLGEDRAIADYLVEEILERQPPATRRLLLQTSICADVGVDLAVHLTGQVDAGAVLDRLERDHVLTHRVGGPDPVYRYHELLRTYHQAELRRTDHDEYLRLQAAAARWYDARRDGVRALEHAVAAGDHTLTGALLRRHGVGLLDHHTETLDRVLDRIDRTAPPDPTARLLRAELALREGRTADAELALTDATHHVGTDPWARALHAVVTLHRARHGGDVVAALAGMPSADVGADVADHELELLTLWHRGAGRLLVDDRAGAIADLERALRLAEALGRTATSVACLSLLASGAATSQDLPGARRYADRALELARPRGWEGWSVVGLAHLVRAVTSSLWGEREDARGHVDLAVASLDDHSFPTARLVSRWQQAILDVEEGGSAVDAVHRIRDAWRRFTNAEAPPLDDLPYAVTVPAEVDLCLAIGEAGLAAEAAQRTVDRLPGTAEAILVRAQIDAGRGRGDAARTLLRPVLDGSVHPVTCLTPVRAWMLEAELLAARGMDQCAFDAMCEAVALAESDDLVGVVLRAGAAVPTPLVDNLGRFGHREAFVTRILASRPARPLTPAPVALTDTELQILRDLPSLRTVDEIAASRVVSINTVKTHLRSIYRKLGASNRRDAVAEGRARGLL